MENYQMVVANVLNFSPQVFINKQHFPPSFSFNAQTSSLAKKFFNQQNLRKHNGS